MARIRTIKPSFWGSPTVAKLSRDARLLAVGLISMADDDGRFLCSTAAVNGYVFPNDDLPSPTNTRSTACATAASPSGTNTKSSTATRPASSLSQT
jgi:hypothetical protein